MSNRKLGIHLAPGALKLVEVEQQAKDIKVLNYSVEYFPLEQGLDARIKTLISSLKKNKIRTKDANVVLSGAEIIYKLVDMPEMSEKDITSAIQYKLKNVLPVSFKDIVVDHYKITKSPGKYFVAAVPKEKILELIESVKASGLSLKDIVAPSCALRNALRISAAEPSALIFLGRYSSIIVLLKQGQVVFAREVNVGGDDITRAMVGVVQTEQKRVELDYKQAEAIKNKYGIPVDLNQYTKEAGLPAAEILAMMRPALEKLSTEILNTFDYYRQEIKDETEFKKIYFTGGTTKTRNLLEYFREQLGLALEPLPVEIDPCLALALGSVMTGKDHLSLVPKKSKGLELGNFAAPVLRRIKKGFKYIFMGFVSLLTLALVLGWFYAQQRDLSVTHQALQKKYQAHMAKVGKEAELQQGIAGLIKYGSLDRFTLVMHELDKITPDNIYFKGLSYNNNQNQVVISGVMLESGGKRSLAKFIEKLKQSKYFESIDLVYMQESGAFTVPTYDFELKCLLAGESRK